MSWSLPACVSHVSKAQSKVPQLSKLRSLNLHILEAHRLPFKRAQPVLYRVAEPGQSGKTRVQTVPDPVWDEEFVLE
ncbi:hypothetical protein pipiens_000414, partial [Culex pipiens pipiens]